LDIFAGLFKNDHLAVIELFVTDYHYSQVR